MEAMTNYCPGAAVGSPALVPVRDADYYERRDRAFVEEMRVVWPDHYATMPHRTGTCHKCVRKGEPVLYEERCLCDRQYIQFLAHPDGYNVRFRCWNCGWHSRSDDALAALKFSHQAERDQARRSPRPAAAPHKSVFVDADNSEKVDKLLGFLQEWFLSGKSAIHSSTLVDDSETFDDLVCKITLGRGR